MDDKNVQPRRCGLPSARQNQKLSPDVDREEAQPNYRGRGNCLCLPPLPEALAENNAQIGRPDSVRVTLSANMSSSPSWHNASATSGMIPGPKPVPHPVRSASACPATKASPSPNYKDEHTALSSLWAMQTEYIFL